MPTNGIELPTFIVLKHELNMAGSLRDVVAANRSGEVTIGNRSGVAYCGGLVGDGHDLALP